MILPDWPMEKIKKSLTENYYYFLSEFFQDSPHIQLIRDSQISMLVSDVPDSRFNCVFKTNLTDTDLTRKIQEIKQIYAKHEVPFAWLVSEDDRPHNLGDKLEKYNFTFQEKLTGMIKVISEPLSLASSTLTIKKAMTTRELLDYANPLPKLGVSDLFAKTLGTLPMSNFISTPFEVYVGYRNKHPVVSGLLVNYAAVAGIYNCFGAYDEDLRETYEQDMMRFILNRAIELKLLYAVTVTHLPDYPLYKTFDFQGCSYFKKFILKEW